MVAFTPAMELRLTKHRLRHIKAGNPMGMISKHINEMKRNMRRGMSFSKSHTIAQKKYAMI